MAPGRQQLGIRQRDMAEHAAVVISAWPRAFPTGQGSAASAASARALHPAAQGPLRRRSGPDQTLVGGGADLVDRAGRERDQPGALRAGPAGGSRVRAGPTV